MRRATRWRATISGALRRTQTLRGIALAWLLLVVAGSLQPKRPLSVAGLHRPIHWLAFAGAGFLLLLLSRNRRQAFHRAILAFLLGLSLEGVQHFLYRRAMEWLDVCDDALAILIALALYWVIARPNRPETIGA